jgi:hypothetical protein
MSPECQSAMAYGSSSHRHTVDPTLRNLETLLQEQNVSEVDNQVTGSDSEGLSALAHDALRCTIRYTLHASVVHTSRKVGRAFHPW